MRKFNRLIIFVIIILETNFFSLIDLSSYFININSYYSKKLILILIILGIIVNIPNTLVKNKTIFNNMLDVYVLLFLAGIFITGILSFIAYDQSIVDVITVAYFYLILLFYFYLKIAYLNDDKIIEYLFKLIIGTGTIYSLILIVQYLFLQNGMPVFLSLHPETTIILSIDNNPRISRPADFIALSTLLSGILLLDRHGKTFIHTKKYLFNNKNMFFSILIQIIYLVFVSQTRMYILSILIPFLVAYILMSKNRLLKIFLNLSLFLIIILNLNQIKLFVFTFVYGDRLSSTAVRIDEIVFYGRQIFNNFIFGRGLLLNKNFEYTYLNHGPDGAYNITDIGYIGYLSVFGLIGILCSAFLFIILFNYLISIYKHKKAKEYNYLFFILISTGISSITLSFTDIQRITLFPVILFIINFIFLNFFKEAKYKNI